MASPHLTALAPRDVLYIRRVRNGQDVRVLAGGLPTVGLWEHLLWYARNAREIHRHSFVVIADGRRAGYIRLGMITGNCAEISIALEPWAQGRGIGLHSLTLATSVYRKRAFPARLMARVHRGNVKSLALFERAGFVVTMTPTRCKYIFLTRDLHAPSA